MSENKATWSLSLDTECPECKETVNLLDAADFWDGTEFQACESGTPRTKDVEVLCPECDKTFEVDLEW